MGRLRQLAKNLFVIARDNNPPDSIVQKFTIPLEVVDSSHDSHGSFDIRFGDVSSSFDMSSPCVWRRASR